MKSEPQVKNEPTQPNTRQGVGLEMVYRALLKIVAHLDERQYTEGPLYQTAERQPDDLADPASDTDTSQG